jgi:hypothetical protein
MMNRHRVRILYPGHPDPAAETGLAGPAPDARTIALVAMALVIVVFALHLGAAFFIPLLVSLFSSYALSPAVSRLERWHIPRALGAALTMLLVIAALGFGVERSAGPATCSTSCRVPCRSSVTRSFPGSATRADH